MKKNLIVSLVLLISGFVSANVYAIDYSFTTIDYPGAYYGTEPLGIDGNNIVGYYEYADVKNHGFLYNGSTYTPFDVPGALATVASGIDGNNIVGYYIDASYIGHGFLYNGSTYTTLDVAGAVFYTRAYGIDGNNIVGWYHAPEYPGVFDHGFLYDGSTYTTFNVPGAMNTWPYGIDGNNIVGTYEDTKNVIRGFLYDGSTYTTLNFPGAYITYAYGIYGNNIVGSYYNAGPGSIANGFLYNGSTYTTFNVPGASLGTVAYGIDGNNIVGVYYDGYTTHGFLATPVSQTWFEEDDPAITYSGTWNTYTCSSCSGGALKYSNQTGAKADFTFNGTGIKWMVTKAKMLGKAKVYLDGVYYGMVDLYSLTPRWQVVLQKIGLTFGTHTATIEVSGMKNPSSTGYNIDIDAMEVVP